MLLKFLFITAVRNRKNPFSRFLTVIPFVAEHDLLRCVRETLELSKQVYLSR